MYGSASTAVTKHHRVGGLNHRHLFLAIVESGSLRSGGQHSGFLVRAFHLLASSSHGEESGRGVEEQTVRQGEKARERVGQGRERDRKRELCSPGVRALAPSRGPYFRDLI